MSGTDNNNNYPILLSPNDGLTLDPSSAWNSQPPFFTTTVPGSSVIASFTGSAFCLAGFRSPGTANFTVTIDDQRPRLVLPPTTSSPTGQDTSLLLFIRDLNESQSHEITITHRDYSNAPLDIILGAFYRHSFSNQDLQLDPTVPCSYTSTFLESASTLEPSALPSFVYSSWLPFVSSSSTTSIDDSIPTTTANDNDNDNINQSISTDTNINTNTNTDNNIPSPTRDINDDNSNDSPEPQGGTILKGVVVGLFSFLALTLIVIVIRYRGTVILNTLRSWFSNYSNNSNSHLNNNSYNNNNSRNGGNNKTVTFGLHSPSSSTSSSTSEASFAALNTSTTKSSSSAKAPHLTATRQRPHSLLSPNFALTPSSPTFNNLATASNSINNNNNNNNSIKQHSPTHIFFPSLSPSKRNSQKSFQVCRPSSSYDYYSRQTTFSTTNSNTNTCTNHNNNNNNINNNNNNNNNNTILTINENESFDTRNFNNNTTPPVSPSVWAFRSDSMRHRSSITTDVYTRNRHQNSLGVTNPDPSNNSTPTNSTINSTPSQSQTQSQRSSNINLNSNPNINSNSNMNDNHNDGYNYCYSYNNNNPYSPTSNNHNSTLNFPQSVAGDDDVISKISTPSPPYYISRNWTTTTQNSGTPGRASPYSIADVQFGAANNSSSSNRLYSSTQLQE